MKPVLLVGNGINRCEGGSGYPSWDSLLESIGNDLFSQTAPTNSQLLKYEQLICHAMTISASSSISKRIEKRLRTLDTITADKGSLHARIWDTGITTVLTTNYDYSLERGLQSSHEFTSDNWKKHGYNETVASKYRHKRIGEHRVYHIHGELDLFKTVCLGQIHYATNLMRIMEALDEPKADGSERDDFKLRSSLFDNTDAEVKTWAEYFFTHDLYILGLSMAESDFDLWWLISYWAKLYGEGSLPKQNEIFFFDVREDPKPSAIETVLEKLHVTVLPQTVQNGDWRQAYAHCIALIGERIVSSSKEHD